ncbi:hypothetical protein J2Y63_002087 [Shinella sp. BE166]|uniref:hypothetical protein n=1 Tax=Shinella sp. BE166 TaxID=3373918 RepID=UPI003EBBAFB3
MARRPAVGDFPRYGYTLVSEGRVVGVMLTLYFHHPGVEAVRCNLSSWTVDEDFRAYAGKLVMSALRRREDSQGSGARWFGRKTRVNSPDDGGEGSRNQTLPIDVFFRRGYFGNSCRYLPRTIPLIEVAYTVLP